MLKEVESEVNSFLKSKDPQILVVKGAWGTGKTHAWKNFLYQASKKNEIPQKQYAYVSLFGCNSLDELKAQIFEQSIPVDAIGDGVNFDSISENVNSIFEKKNWGVISVLLGKINKISKGLQAIPVVKDFTIDVWRIGWLMTRDTLICVDDLERAGADLRIKDVYGLMSFLKEQKKCKIVLILNEESIIGDNKEDYTSHREKVVDLEIHFNPEPKELISLVFPEDYPHLKIIESYICSLRLVNIRTIQRIRSYLDKLSPLLNSVDEIYYHNAIRSIVLFTVLHFSKPKDWPELEEILKVNSDEFAMIESLVGKEGVDPTKYDKSYIERMALLQNIYGWSGAEEIDQVFGDFIKKGYINKIRLQELINQAAKETERIRKKKLINDLHSKVGDIVWEGLEDNVDQILPAMEESLRASSEMYSSIAHLNQYVIILRQLERSTEAHSLIQKYIKMVESKGARFLNISGSDLHFAGTLDDELVEIITAAHDYFLQNEIDNELKNMDPISKLKEVAQRSVEYNLAKKDYKLLARFEESIFSDFFTETIDNKETQTFIKIFLSNRAAVPDCNKEHTTIQGMVAAAIKKLAANSKLNELRLKEYLKIIDDQL